MAKATDKSEGVAASVMDNPGALTTTTGTSSALSTDNGDVSGQIKFTLSQELQDSLSLELREALHQIEQGFGELTAPGKIFDMDQPFFVIDGATINDYVDQTSGEVKTKHIFRLEFENGMIKTVMQSTARPRAVLADGFTKARALGARLKCGPFRFEKKPIPRQIQPAFIFAQQQGFKAELY